MCIQKKSICNAYNVIRLFYAYAQLLHRMETHTGEIPYMCCSSPNNLVKRTLLKCIMESSSYCNINERFLILKQHLVTQLEKYTGDKPLKCIQTRSTALLISIDCIEEGFHTGKIPYICIRVTSIQILIIAMYYSIYLSI